MRRWWRRNRVPEGTMAEVDGSDGQPTGPWWERLITVALCIVVGAFLLVTFTAVIVPGVFPDWFGVQEVAVTNQNVRHYVPEKTLWDWFGLIAIPLSIVVVGYVLNWADRSHERRLQEQRIVENRNIEEERLKETRDLERERAQDAALESYLDQMTDLLLNHTLRDSVEDDEVRSVARARTLTVLRGVDQARKGTIIQFLYEARLIGYRSRGMVIDPVVRLHGADLVGAGLVWAKLAGAQLGWLNLGQANLTRAQLEQANLRGARLERSTLFQAKLCRANLERAILFKARFERADLEGAILLGANLERAILFGARLEQAKLAEANLAEANLTGANLIGADLTGANLIGADVGGANLRGANLRGANLRGADLRGADIGYDQLLDTKSLHGTILPISINPTYLGDKWSPPPEDKSPPQWMTPSMERRRPNVHPFRVLISKFTKNNNTPEPTP